MKRNAIESVLYWPLIKPAQAQSLILRSSGLSYKELADALNIKMTSIGTILNRAEEEFRNRYLALHPNEEETMTCIHDGILRAHLDGELAGAELQRSRQHLISCTDCRARFEKLVLRGRRLEGLVGDASPGCGQRRDQSRDWPTPSLPTNLELPIVSRRTWMTRLFAPRWRPPGDSRWSHWLSRFW